MMLRFLSIAALVVVLDQLTKWAALKYLVRHVEVAVVPFVNLTLAYNRGAAFSFLSDAGGWQNAFFSVVAAIACAVIIYMLYRTRGRDPLVSLGLVFVLGGAVGNLVDRLLYGHVVDFIDVYYRHWHWPTFNIADSAITIGAILLILDALGFKFGRRHANSNSS
jgi:signal peptidase II